MKINFNNPFNRKKDQSSSKEKDSRLLEIEKSIEELEEKKNDEEKNLEDNLKNLSSKEKTERMLEILKLQKEKAEANYKKADIERELRNNPETRVSSAEKSDEKEINTKNEGREAEDNEAAVPNEKTENIKPEETEKDKNKSEGTENYIKNFLNEYKLENLAPEQFNNLKNEQKIFVIQHLKKRIVDIVKTRAETQYSEELKNKYGNKATQNNFIGKLKSISAKAWTSIKEGSSKELKIKNLESRAFKELIEVDGKKIKEEIELLTENIKERDVYLNEKGESYIYYIDPPKDSEYTVEEFEKIMAFNNEANAFSNLPYEWGQENKTLTGKVFKKVNLLTNKEQYDKAKLKYEKARNELINLLGKEKNSNERVNIMEELHDVDSLVRMEQLSNTHPEIDQELKNLKKNWGTSEILKTADRAIIGRFNRYWKIGLFAGGYIFRGKAQSLSLQLGASTTIASGAIIGGVRGFFQGKEQLKVKQKEARYGKNEKSKERKAVVDIAHLTQKLNDLSERIEKLEFAKIEAQGIKDKGMKKNVLDHIDSELAKSLGMLMVRIEHSKGKTEKGEVNFGNKEDILVNQMNFSESLNRAVVLREMLSEENSKKIEEDLNKTLSAVAKGTGKTTAKRRNQFILNKIGQGMKIGAGFATFGYVVRWIQDNWHSADLDKVKLDEKIPETKEEIVIPPVQEEVEAPEEYIDRGEDVDAEEVSKEVEKPKVEKSTEKEPENYETDNGWNKVTEEELKKQDTIEKIQKNDGLENEPTTKVQGSKIVWTEGESGGGEIDQNTSKVQGSKITWTEGKSGGDNIDENTSKVQGSKIVWTEGESGKINETPIPKEETPEAKEEETIPGSKTEEKVKEEPHEEYTEPKGENENRMGPPTEEEMAEYQEPKEIEKTVNEKINIGNSEEYAEPLSEEEMKQGGISGEEEYSEPIKSTEKQASSDIPNKIEYTEPEKEIPSNTENPYSLNETQLQEIKTINTENLSKVFGEKMSTWDNIKVLPAHEDIESVGLTEQKQSFIKYLKKLREESGLEPKVETLVSKAETNEEYIKRVFAEMAKRGQLDKLKL